MGESSARPTGSPRAVPAPWWRRSLRRRFAIGFGLLVLFGAVVIRVMHYRASAELLARDLDVQLWARLGTLKAQERFAPETLLDPQFHVAELFMPDAGTARGWTASHAVGAIVPHAGALGDPAGFTWFAGVWQPDGTPVDALDLPEAVAWEPGWLERLDTLWTSADGRHRLAATAGAHGTVLVAGTPLADLAAACRRVLFVNVATFVGWIPVVLGCAWLLLRRLLAPLGGIAATAQRIRGGHFEERIDVARADEEIAGMAATLNEMLDRLDAVRVAQSRFNADVAHQLLNPVHAILLEADVALSRPRGAEELVASVERVGGLARRIESLCEALLTFSRTAVLDPARLQLVDLEPIVSDAVDQVTPSATARGIRIEAEGSAVVRGDAGLLHEAFVNLLANAVTHTPDGGGIEVVVDRLATGHRVRIIDHGGGVPAEVAEHLFERFQSATPGGGHGIGLALCRGILRSHGGDIVHEPTPGGGATFEVRFPDPATGP
jgi:signal transduction histidine kinase